MILPIFQYPHPSLRQVCKPVDLSTGEARYRANTLVNNIAETMYNAKGVGISAPQVGVFEQIVIVDVGERGAEHLKVLINPTVIHSTGKSIFKEGCLSVPGVYEQVERAAVIRVWYWNLFGERLEQVYDGFLATVLQHEIDHLSGVLFIDKLSRLKRTMALKYISVPAYPRSKING